MGRTRKLMSILEYEQAEYLNVRGIPLEEASIFLGYPRRYLDEVIDRYEIEQKKAHYKQKQAEIVQNSNMQPIDAYKYLYMRGFSRQSAGAIIATARTYERLPTSALKEARARYRERLKARVKAEQNRSSHDHKKRGTQSSTSMDGITLKTR